MLLISFRVPFTFDFGYWLSSEFALTSFASLENFERNWITHSYQNNTNDINYLLIIAFNEYYTFLRIFSIWLLNLVQMSQLFSLKFGWLIDTHIVGPNFGPWIHWDVSLYGFLPSSVSKYLPLFSPINYFDLFNVKNIVAFKVCWEIWSFNY